MHIFSLQQSPGRNVLCTCSEDALCIFTFHSLRLKSFLFQLYQLCKLSTDQPRTRYPGYTRIYVLGMVLHKCTEWKAASTNGDNNRQNCFELRHFLLACFIRLCGLRNIKNHWSALKFLLDAVFGNLALTADFPLL